MIYRELIDGIKRYGSTEESIVRGLFECEPQDIRERVIIAPVWKPEDFKGLYVDMTPISKIYSDYRLWDLKTTANYNCTYVQTGIGSPILVDAVLGLGCTACKKIIFLGAAGALDVDMAIGDVVVPDYSVSGDGVCRYLAGGRLADSDTFGQKYYPDSKLSAKLSDAAKSLCSDMKTGFFNCGNISVDTIMAEYMHLDEIRQYGCQTIEMETAAFFRAAELTGMSAAAIFCILDNTLAKKPLFADDDADSDIYKQVKASLLPAAILKALK